MQTLLNWVSHNSDYAIFAVFFVSTLESLALVGIMVPGMLFMLGVGTLIGIGTLSFWPMFFAATLGAITGDGLSFWLGRHFNQNLRHVWPLPKFPGLLHKGEDFFHRHGAMSVFFGRFIGPLRAIIPAVAGMLQMEPGRFLIFNVISALSWAPVVLLPGAILGASLAQVSAVAARFGLLIFIVGLGFWCIGWVINHTMRRLLIRRFPNLAYAQVWRLCAHAVVYSMLIAAALLYRVQIPAFPSQQQLLNLVSQAPPLSDKVSEQFRSVVDNGFSVLWLGDTRLLRQALEHQGWLKAERWSMVTALAWLADDTDPMQLVYSDPRIKMHKLSLRDQAWVRAGAQGKVWLLRMWSPKKIHAAEKAVALTNKDEAVSMIAIKRVSLYQGVMGYRYYCQESLAPSQKQAFFDDPMLFPSALRQALRQLNLSGSGDFLLLQGDADTQP